MRGGNTKGMMGLLLLFLPAIAQGVPTLSGYGKDAVASGCWLSTPEKTKRMHIDADIRGLVDWQLAAVAGEFHKHSVISAETSASASGTKTFPPVPSALLMVLTGFLCISLVRDRRAWLTALMCLLWAGQAGVSLLPRLALCVAGERRREQPTRDCVAGPGRPVHVCRWPGEIERAHCAGLLRCLAGRPDRSLPRIRADRRFGPLQSIIGTRDPFEVCAVSNLPLDAGPVVRPASVLVGAKLARGPPSIGRIAHLLHIEG